MTNYTSGNTALGNSTDHHREWRNGRQEHTSVESLDSTVSFSQGVSDGVMPLYLVSLLLGIRAQIDSTVRLYIFCL